MSVEGERLKAARVALHWQRKDLAAVLSLSDYTIFAWERGDRSVPDGLASWLEGVARDVAAVVAAHPVPELERTRTVTRAVRRRGRTEGWHT